MGFGGPIKKKICLYAVKLHFIFTNCQLAVAKTLNTNFLYLKICQGLQCHSSAHFDLRTSFCCLRSLKSAGNSILKCLETCQSKKWWFIITWEGLGWVTLCTQKEANAFSIWSNNLRYQGILGFLIRNVLAASESVQLYSHFLSCFSCFRLFYLQVVLCWCPWRSHAASVELRAGSANDPSTCRHLHGPYVIALPMLHGHVRTNQLCCIR
jgi:hypothetical protein